MTAAILLWLASSLLGATAAYASHWAHYGWYHEHTGYPSRPSGLTELNNRFGAACNSNAYFNRNVTWQGQVAGGGVQSFTPSYHKKLGGATTTGFFARTGGSSTNMEDVVGHLGDAHKLYEDGAGNVKGGIYGYLCRTISGSSKYSVHSWGAAMDINASYEQYPDPDCQPNSFGTGVSAKWENHRWYWGANFAAAYCDPMHFQYVTNY